MGTAKTFWITKWAFTRGIIQADGCKENDSGYACRGRYASQDYIFAKIGTDAFATERAARDRVLAMINARLAAIEKEREKLIALFDRLK